MEGDGTNISIKVTGVNGFLGAHVVDQLVQKGYRVRGYAIAQIVIFVSRG